METTFTRGEIKAALAWVTDDETRAHMRCVVVGRRYLAASNGHGALVVTSGDPTAEPGGERLTVPPDALNRAVKTKGCVTVVVLDAELVVMGKNGECLGKIPFVAGDAKAFPPVHQVTPDLEGKKIGFDLEYLRDMCQSLLDAGAPYDKTAIYISGPLDPIRFQSANGVTGVLMPVRL